MQIFENPQEMAEAIGSYWKELQSQQKDEFLVAAPLSSTPLPLYNWVIANAESFSHWEQFRFVLMDEQVEGMNSFEYVSSTDAASYERFAKEKFLNSLHASNIGLVENVILKPEIHKMKEFDEVISSRGGIDLLILAIGVKGHYAQVMPGTSVEMGFHITKLIPELGAVHTQKGSQSYEGAQFREYGMTLGPKQVLEAKQVVIMISGESKKDIAADLFGRDSFDLEFPLSIIYHPELKERVKIFVSKEVVES